MKIKEEQLEIIREHQKDLTTILNNIGYLEAQKHGVLHHTVIEIESKEEVKADLKVLENVE